MKKILLLFLAAVLTGCGIYLAFYIYGGYREDKEVKDSMKSVELLQSQAVVPKEDAGGGQAPDEPDGNTSSINPGISVDFGVLSDTNPDIMAWLNSHVRTEIDRVHREAARDRHHAFGSVEIAKPDPWRHRTGLTI